MIILKLAAYIFESDIDSVTISDLSKQLNVHKSTLISAIYDYNRAKLEHCGLELTIGDELLYIQFSPLFSLDCLRQTMFRKTILFDLCDTLFHKRFTTLALFSKTHFISLSSMYRRLNKLKIILDEFSIGLNFSGPQYFIGKETQIRHFIFELYTLAYGASDDYLLNTPIGSTQSILDLETHLTNYSFQTARKIKLAVFISVARCRQRQYITDDLSLLDPYEPDLTHNELKQIMFNVLNPIRPKCANIDAETDFFSIYIQTLHVIPIERSNHINPHSLKFNPPHIELANNWINHFTNFFGVELSSESYLFLLINLYNYYIRVDLLSHSSIHNLESQEMYSFSDLDHSYVYNKTIQFIAYLTAEQTTSPSIHFDYFCYFLIREVLLRSSKSVNICIRTSSFHIQKRNIEDSLKAITQVPITTTEAVSSQTDLIITNSPQDATHFKNQQQPIQVALIDSFPKKTQLITISTTLLTIYDQQFTN